MTVDRLYATTGDAFHRLERSGSIWSAASSLGGTGAQCLARDPHDRETVYVGCRGSGLYRSHNGGESWENLGLPHADVFSIAPSPADGRLYAGCEPSMVFRSDDGGAGWRELEALRRLPSAPSWSFPPRPWTSHVRWLAPDPLTPGVLLAGIELGGLMFSADAGETWEDHRENAQRDVHALAWHMDAPGRAYQAGGGGTAWSHDGGRSWVRVDGGRDRHYTWGIAVCEADPDCWFVSASSGPWAAHSGDAAEAVICRWRGEGPWETLDGGLPQPLMAFPYALATAGDEVFAGLGDGRLLRSPDLGETWAEIDVTGETPTTITALACA
jgi:hypothetical protein